MIDGLMPKRPSKQERLRVIALAGACMGAFRAVVFEWMETGMRGDPQAMVAEVARHLKSGFAPST